MKGIRIGTGAFVGLLLGIFFEYVNGFFTFVLPPWIVITPFCVILGTGIGAMVGPYPNKKHCPA